MLPTNPDFPYCGAMAVKQPTEFLGPFMYPWKKSLNTQLLPGVTWVTKDLVWVCTGVKFVVTTADAVTDVTARTPWVDARVTSSVEAAGAAAVRCWVCTTCAVAVPPEVWKGTQSIFLTVSIPHIKLWNLMETDYTILETNIKNAKALQKQRRSKSF